MRAFVGISILLITSFAFGVTQPKKVGSLESPKATTKSLKPKAMTNAKKEYGTSHAFNSASIKGKVQEGNMRRIVVENDKSLEDLLGVRKNFADRDREESERN